METLDIRNPFGAFVYYKETVESTMDEARRFTSGSSGTVIAADEQTAGRGRSGRPWAMNRGENLSFTIMLKFGSVGAIPPALTLRTGLAVALAVEDFAPALAGRVLVKWPNDVMIAGLASGGRSGGAQGCAGKNDPAKKAVGILAEAAGGNVYIGIGVNVAQKTFPPELAQKACSIAQALSCLGDSTTDDSGTGAAPAAPFAGTASAAAIADKRFTLLEKILFRLHGELYTVSGGRSSGTALDWRSRLEEKLYMKGRRVRFIPGMPEELSRGRAAAVEGTLRGIGEDGAILITPDTGKIRSFAAGEQIFLAP